NDKESAGKTKSCQKNQHLGEGQSVQRNSESEHGHANGAKRNEAVLNLSRRQQTSRVTANADADCQRRLEIASMGFVKVQDFSSIKNNHELKQRTQKPEIRVAHDSQVQYAIRAHELILSFQIAKKVETKFLGRIRHRHFGNRETCRQTQQ